MIENEKERSGIPCGRPPCGKANLTLGGSTLFFISSYTLFSRVTDIVISYGHVGLSGRGSTLYRLLFNKIGLVTNEQGTN